MTISRGGKGGKRRASTIGQNPYQPDGRPVETGGGGVGPAGPAGAPGATGPAGFGLPGEPGQDGEDGYPGAPGPAGAAGAAGATGSTGPAGAPGVDGADGADGEAGPPGAAGAAGSAGATGATGAAGANGIPGIDGEDGIDGIPGARGADGAAGAAGATGAAGAMGRPGLDGDDGADGYGWPGPAGATGATGASGGAGGGSSPTIWLPGADGDDGADGMAAPRSSAAYRAIWRTVLHVGGSHIAGRIAGSYAFAYGDPLIFSGAGTLFPMVVLRVDLADYPAIEGVTAKFKIKATVLCNDVAPATNFTFGLHPITRPAISGGAGLVIATMSAAVAGSTAAILAPAVDSMSTQDSGTFAVPGADWYVLGCVTSAQPPASSHTWLTAVLQVAYL